MNYPIAENLRALRKFSRLSQEEVAERVGAFSPCADGLGGRRFCVWGLAPWVKYLLTLAAAMGIPLIVHEILTRISPLLCPSEKDDGRRKILR